MTGVVDARTRNGLVHAMASLVLHDGEGLLEAVETLGIAGPDVGHDRLRADLMVLAESYLDQPLGDLSLAAMLRDLLAVVRRHHLHLPPNLALLVKTLGMAEGVAAQLDPSFRIMSVILPFVQVLAPPPAEAATS
jgi:ubiquinone biosynthesis protein